MQTKQEKPLFRATNKQIMTSDIKEVDHDNLQPNNDQNHQIESRTQFP